MHVGAALDSCDQRHTYAGYMFNNLNAFVVNLASNVGMGDVTER
jgi:hypothetical protein